jgi:rod shape-determining protein MreD
VVPGALTPRIWGRLAFVVLMTAIVQVSVFNQLSLHGAHPDGFLLLAVMLGLLAGPQQGAVLAFAVGLVADLLVQTPFGLSCLTYVLVAFGVGSLASLSGTRAPNGFRVLVGLAGGVVGSLLFDALRLLLDQPGIAPRQMLLVCLVVGSANAILAVPVANTLTWVLRASAARRDLAGVTGGSASR